MILNEYFYAQLNELTRLDQLDQLDKIDDLILEDGTDDEDEEDDDDDGDSDSDSCNCTEQDIYDLAQDILVPEIMIDVCAKIDEATAEICEKIT